MEDELPYEKYRVTKGAYGSMPGDQYGLFFIPLKKSRVPLKIICAPMDSKWQHVSVSLPNRCPTWNEMCLVKDLFWDEETTVVQYHPKKSEHVNNHPYCLHMWRNTVDEVVLPPSFMVGVK